MNWIVRSYSALALGDPTNEPKLSGRPIFTLQDPSRQCLPSLLVHHLQMQLTAPGPSQRSRSLRHGHLHEGLPGEKLPLSRVSQRLLSPRATQKPMQQRQTLLLLTGNRLPDRTTYQANQLSEMSCHRCQHTFRDPECLERHAATCRIDGRSPDQNHCPFCQTRH